MARLFSFLLLVLALLPSTAFAQARDNQGAVRTPRRGTASISGVVVSAESGRPVRLARVTATSSEGDDSGRLATTDENGRFTLPELPAGRYRLSASKSGFLAANFGQTRPLRPGKPIEMRDGEAVRDIELRLPRGSAITGRVLDQEGEPIVGASIRALRSRVVQGQARVDIAGSGETDDRGIFRIFNLPPGNYYVSAVINNLVTTATLDSSGMFTSMSSGADTASTNITYAPTYYPGVTSIVSATPIALPVSQEVGGIDFTLILVPAARVSGVVVTPVGVAANSLVLLVAEEARGAAATTGQGFSGRTNRDGTFTIPAVPPGRYIAVSSASVGRGGDNRMYGMQSISVTPGIVSGITLTVQPGTTVFGSVTFDGASSPSPAEISRIRATLAVASGSELPGFAISDTSTPRADGSFTWQNAMPGPRTVRVMGLPKGWTLKSIYADGHDVTDTTFELQANARVQIVLTDRGNELSGTVHDSQDRPLPDITVIAFPADAQLWRPLSRFIQAIRTDKDGAYTLRGLPAGEYLLRAVDDVDQGEWYDPALLETLRRGAERVQLKETDKKSQDLRLSPITQSWPGGGYGPS